MNIYILSIIILIMINGFGAFGATIPNFVILVIIVIGIIKSSKQKKLIYNKPFIFLAIGLFLNMLSCYVFERQPIISTFSSSIRVIWVIFFYYFLASYKFKSQIIEKTIVCFSVISCILYITQHYLIDKGINFLNINMDFIVGEEKRMRMVASGFISLLYFYSLNKIMIGDENRNKHIVFIILSIIPIILMGFRTMVFGITLFSLIQMIWIFGVSKRLIVSIILATVLFGSATKIPFIATKINEMTARQENDQSFDNSDYIRILQYKYFTNDHFKSYTEEILGSGIPDKTSEYGKKMSELQDLHIYYVDWGIIGYSWVLGIIPATCMLWYVFTLIRFRFPDRYKYISVWFIYLTAISFTTVEFCRSGNFIVQSLVLYLSLCLKRENKILGKYSLF